MPEIRNFEESFRSAFREFYGSEKENEWKLFYYQDSRENHFFSIQNPLGGRALVFSYYPDVGEFYALLKIQVIPGEEDWLLDSLFQKRGYSQLTAKDLLQEKGVWLFDRLAIHYFSTIQFHCPRILEPDFRLF